MTLPKTSAFPTIVRILAVRDTRDRIEVGDRWVPVPGSGQRRPCDRCGREHEIHVDVELSDGTHANIGSGCAKGESMEVQSRLKSAVHAAKTRSRLSAELAVAKDEHARAAEAWHEVEALHAPSPELLEEIPDTYGTREPRQIWGMGDANVWTSNGRNFDTERRQALLRGWQSNRYRERGFELPPYSYKQKIDAIADRLAKIDRKLSALMF